MTPADPDFGATATKFGREWPRRGRPYLRADFYVYFRRRQAPRARTDQLLLTRDGARVGESNPSL
jgi:hypothetical protein